MFEAIIQYFIDQEVLHDRAAFQTREFVAYLESQTDYTQQMLRQTIDLINYETLEPDPQTKIFPTLELFRGVDSYETRATLNYDGDVAEIDALEHLVKDWNWGEMTDIERIAAQKKLLSHKIDTRKYPVSLLGATGDGLDQAALYYAWIAWNWQEIEGYRCSIQAATIQNNSANRYSLNDYIRDDFSMFMENHRETKPPRLDAYFPRKLSIVELFLRASQKGYPFNPFKNYWRYFEKHDTFKEFCTYDCAVGVRTGRLSERQSAVVKIQEQHPDSKSALNSLTRYTTEAIFEGWEEKLRPPGLPDKMHARAYDFNMWTGISWPESKKENQIRVEALKSFEAKFKLVLPDAFFEFLRMFNGKINEYNRYFPVNDLYLKKVERFYPLAELESFRNQGMENHNHLLRIAELSAGEHLWLCTDPQRADFGKLCVQTANNTFETCDYSFEKSVRYAQSHPVQAEIFAAQENDAIFLKKRLAEGWDAATSYHYLTAIEEAASHNAHEALEVLLQHGLRLRDKNFRARTYEFDEKTIEILEKYD